MNFASQEQFFWYLVGLLNKMKDHGLLDEQLFSIFHGISEKGGNNTPEKKDQYDKDIQALTDFIQKNSSVSINEQIMHGSPTHKKVRIYMDGCFDLMHSGHFNAIRQVNTLLLSLLDSLVTSIIGKATRRHPCDRGCFKSRDRNQQRATSHGHQRTSRTCTCL